ncbi:MAG: sulfide/dihydroorotate dehydrogenase-like FAD/NAD-binding protein [bacterium]|nr:sulfide/dihydroorotate dehydrogenase-like FAD/NAD-binding protein [bacterium]
MHTIIRKENLAPKIVLFEVSAPLVAAKAKPGHFVIVRAYEWSERIPLTIADHNAETGTITLIIQEIGQGTREICAMEVGSAFLDIVGPLGNPAEIKRVGTMVFIGGGVGVPAIYPEVKEAKRLGNKVITILGAQTKELLILAKELEAVSDQVLYSTNDGSFGIHGFVTDVLKQLLDTKIAINEIIAIGPLPMMKAVSELTKPYGIKTIVSLNAIMVDGTGMCGGCRVTVGGKNKFSCVDGPEFDGHQVDFDELLRRTKQYLHYEKIAVEHAQKIGQGNCRLAPLLQSVQKESSS